MDCWYFTDIDFTDVQQASVSPPCLSLYHFLYGRTCGNSVGKKVFGDQPAVVYAPAKPPANGRVVTYLTPWNLIVAFFRRRKITDHLHHLFLLLLIYSWTITKPSSSPTRTTKTLERIPHWQKSLIDLPLSVAVAYRRWPVTLLVFVYKENTHTKKNLNTRTISLCRSLWCRS